MPTGQILGGLVGEIRNHPWTTLTAMVALAGVIIMFPNYLSANDIAQKVAQIEQTQQSQIKETLASRLGGLKSARFDIQARIEDLRSRGESPDKIFFDELKRLNNEIDEVNLQLEEMR